MPNFGDLDTSFGILGKVITDFSGNNDQAFSIAIDPSNGKIIVAGGTSLGDFALACYYPTGYLDLSFGTSGTGKVITDFGGNDGGGFSVAIDPTSGKIIVAGNTNVNGRYDFALARYTSFGHLDASFGSLGNGLVITNFSGYTFASSIAIAPSGKIIVSGITGNGNPDFALACYTTNGYLDISFGSSGKVITNFKNNINDTYDVASSVAIDPTSGKIIVAGYTDANISPDFALACYTTSGILDASFGLNGFVSTDFGGYSSDIASSIAIDPTNGKIIVAGTRQSNGKKFALACYTSLGNLDISFGLNGLVITDFGGNTTWSVAYSLAISPISGKIIVAGYTDANGSNDFDLACYTTNGLLETSFGSLGTGLVITDFSGISMDIGRSIAIGPSGKIIAAGYTNANGTDDFALACYFGEPVPEESPISNICFPANTPITTNQGTIAIQNLDPKIHTIRNKKIELITKTITQDKYLVCFEKDALGINLPSEKTIITKNHLIYYKGTAMKAKDFVNVFENVNKIKYNGEVLYNVLLKEHDKMMVNNLICETLHPDNKIGQLYKDISCMSPTERDKIIKEYNDYCIKNNTFSKKR
jgi:uncharacterized delta-60 repeat protein